MKLIVGLGNPGKQYESTRHNVGFNMIDYYVSKKKLGNFIEKNNGLFLKTKIFNEDVIFLKPLSYMNLSGEVVKKYLDFYKIETKDILVISDDLDLTIGNFKLKSHGSSGGHNGLKNIELNLGTQEYKRLKIGISNSKDIDTKDYVLGKLKCEEKEIIESLYVFLEKVIDDFLMMDFSILMNKYNQKNR